MVILVFLMILLVWPLVSLSQAQGSAEAADVGRVRIPASLQEMETLSAGVLTWLPELYDPRTGGFYESLATREHPQGGPDIQSTSQVMGILRSTRLLASMPPEIKERMRHYLQSRQDAATGFLWMWIIRKCASRSASWGGPYSSPWVH
ncbi:MAG: hypothetical protein HC904_04295 [Blastochloris sp.]|nr:hypothetical protein [Blastochloris sp.]